MIRQLVSSRWVQITGLALLLGSGAWLWLKLSWEWEEDVPQHVVLIVIATLRADVVDEVETPVLDALAAEGDRVPRAWSSGTWGASARTTASVASTLGRALLVLLACRRRTTPRSRGRAATRRRRADP